MTAPELFAEPLLSLPALAPRADTLRLWWQRWPWGLLQGARTSVEVRLDASAATWRVEAEAGQLLAAALRLFSDMGVPPPRRRAVARAVEVLRPTRAEVWLELRADGADLGWRLPGPLASAAIALLVAQDTPIELCQAFADAHGLRWLGLGAAIGGGHALVELDLVGADPAAWPARVDELGSLLGARLLIEPLPEGLAALPARLALGLQGRTRPMATGVVQPSVRLALDAAWLGGPAWAALRATMPPPLLAIAPELPDTLAAGADRGRPSWAIGWGRQL